jgi:hypothetical protein
MIGFHTPRIRGGIEHKREDCWVGWFWRWDRGLPIQRYTWLNIWICLLPRWPLHIEVLWPMARPARAGEG